MNIVITYGTFDHFHIGHKRLLERAKAHGDYLIVGVTTENYDMSRGKLNVEQTLEERIKNVESTGLADKIILEDYFGQKERDIRKYNAKVFVLGSDWRGEFDYLNQYCQVVYLDRTKDISSTEIRSKNAILNFGIVGNTDVIRKFMSESRYISGINILKAYSVNKTSNKIFDLTYIDNYDDFLRNLDIVYIASYHNTHYSYIKKALENKKHVLCESPIVIEKETLIDLYAIADKNAVILLDAIKTAYAPGFLKLMEVAQSGIIGAIKDIDVSFTSIMNGFNHSREIYHRWGSVSELSAYTILPIIKLLGIPIQVDYHSFMDKDIDLFTKINLYFKNALASSKSGVGVKTEGSLIISGTHGYIYVPAPWWKTQEFEVRFEDFNRNRKYFYPFSDDGLRYEISEMVTLIRRNELLSKKLLREESLLICEIIETYFKKFDSGEIAFL